MARRIVAVTGTINGTNTSFTTPVAFDQSSLFVIVDGQHIAAADTRGATIVSGTSFTTKEVLASGQTLYADIDDLSENGLGFDGTVVYSVPSYRMNVTHPRNTIAMAATDTSQVINFTLQTDAATPVAIDITGATIKLKIRKNGASANTNDANNTCTHVVSASGTFQYQFVSTDLPTIGDYYGQLQITFPTALVHTVPNFIRFTVEEKY